ncbi:MAG: DUF2314 domain-containing protein [Pseudomonadota bacterium]
MLKFALIVGMILIVAAGLRWWLVDRNRPRYLPLPIANDDPDMRAAMAKARAQIDRFRELTADPRLEAQIKVAFETSSGEIEHLWAEVLAVDADVVSVRYVTPPVSHVGSLERLHEHNVDDIEDWVVFAEDGRIFGGYTQRVVFDRARESGEPLPPELAEQAERFVD